MEQTLFFLVMHKCILMMLLMGIILQQALAQLEEKTRHILEFVFLKDLTQRETAEQLGISVVTVSRRVKKGLEMLKETMLQEAF
jgi:RNA polymerase sigma-B factor